MISIFDDSEQVARAAAERFVARARNAIDLQGRFSVALAGGSTPKRAYELIASEPFRDQIDWSHVHLFFGDERAVPRAHPESNYRMVYEKLISKLPIPTENIHRIVGEVDPRDSARAYEEDLRHYFEGKRWPRFDLVLLGMGDDGHTASLFPGTEALKDETAWVTSNWIEKLKMPRITLTAPALNHAAHILFLVTGRDKSARLREVLEGPFDPRRLPAQLIQANEGIVEWLLDQEAANKLQMKQAG